jgi:type IV pilus assembly protein PilB
VATALSAVIAQRLSRRLCMRCREPLIETSEVLTALGFPHDPNDLPQLYKAVGCPACSNTGYRGRVALHEIMTLSDDIESLVVTRSTGSEIRQVALDEGMVSLRQDGWSKVTQGLTTIEEVLRVTV